MARSDAAGPGEGPVGTAFQADDTPGNEAQGLLLVDKPEGPTSHDVVEAVRRVFGGARCGHAGTLDPFASGLLVIGVGKVTRLLRFLSGADKSYEGTIRLGLSTDTDDRTGRPLHEPRAVDFTDEALAAALAAQAGAFEQIPPGFSARKQAGVPSYKLARRGREAPRPASRVRVDWEEWRREEPGLLRIRLTVAAGTYIRAIARDLGAALGCGAHLESLRRTRSGPFRIEDAAILAGGLIGARRSRAGPPPPSVGSPAPAAPPPDLEEARKALGARLLPPHAIPLGLPTESLSEEEVRRLRHGSPLPREGPGPAAGFIRLVGPEGDLAGIAEAETAGGARLLRPRIVL